MKARRALRAAGGLSGPRAGRGPASAWLGLGAALALASPPATAAEWSVTELHFQYGRLDVPTFATGGLRGETQATGIITPQHASGWWWGEVFAFVDLLDARDNQRHPFNDRDAYGEAYASLSAARLAGLDFGEGWLRDLGPIMGVNFGADAEVLKYLPGLRLAWRLPGFAFLNTDFTAYLDDSAGLGGGGAPAETDSFMVDVNWALPFTLGSQRFSLEGHVEYIGGRENELGQPVRAWILAQPQLRWDLGQAWFARPDVLYVGTELQWWQNKLGDGATDELTAQALLVWRI